ncbi:hypothetical protein DTO169E5_859 [Paecilomyces variotii]|nr:hypothetical protein DTO169E5_859 [Paecilomyces variotii]
MAKRKRDNAAKDGSSVDSPRKAIKATTAPEHQSSTAEPSAPVITLQIVTGSYERVLHGFTAGLSLSSEDNTDTSAGTPSVQFSDTFLFHAHASAVRSLAISPLPEPDPSQPQKVILASGGSDERINLYTLSVSPPLVNDKFPSVPTLAGNKILENPKNRELGSLLHHSANISALYFPSRSKLLAGAEDNTISVTKTRDWSVVSTIKAPRPKAQGRPSGDTAPPGASPSGINDFAVHPSMKLMLSVGKGERCMRLWNLVTGKKAGVLNFGKDILQSVKEGRWATGEGRRIVWNAEGEEFAVAFERGAVVFGTDSTPKCKLLPSPLTKLHDISYVTVNQSKEGRDEVLAVSTEDGRVIFYSTKTTQKSKNEDGEEQIPDAVVIAQFGGKPSGLSGRVKDFEILELDGPGAFKDSLAVVTGGSDGAVRIWLVAKEDLKTRETEKSKKESKKDAPSPSQVGTLLGTYETGNRITCLKAFVMRQFDDPSATDDSDFESEEEVEEASSDESDGESE